MKEITIPTNKELLGDAALETIKLIGAKTKVTDYAITNGVYAGEYYTDFIKPSLANRAGYYITKYENNQELNHVVSINGNGILSAENYCFAGVRPIIYYDNLEDYTNELIINPKNQLKMIKYGETMSMVASSEEQLILEQLFQNEELTQSDDVFTENVSINYHDFIPGYKIIYNYNNKKYVRATIDKDIIYDKKGVILSNGVFYPINSSVWLKVEPITWLVDEKNKALLAENILFSARGYHQPLTYEKGLEDNGIDYFLNDCFIKEITGKGKVKKLIK